MSREICEMKLKSGFKQLCYTGINKEMRHICRLRGTLSMRSSCINAAFPPVPDRHIVYMVSLRFQEEHLVLEYFIVYFDDINLAKRG